MYDVVFIGDLIESPTLKSLKVDPELLLRCRGEIGDFHLTYKDGDGKVREVKTGTIVVNIAAEREKPLSGVLSFEDDLPEGKEVDCLIFIQDYQTISPAIMSNRGLKMAISAAKIFPEIQVYYFYRSMRFIKDNDRLFEEARRLGILFLKYEKGNLVISAAGEVSYNREDISLRLEGKILMAPEIKPAEGLERVARILNLEMGPAGFLQAENVYLQPTLSGRRGVYILGGSRGPAAYSNLVEEAEYTLNEIGFLLQDIKPLVNYRREVDDQKCILCYTCYRICPHGAIERDEELDAMKVLNLACQGCNACISHCPASAISIVEDNNELIEAGLRVLMCENSARTAWERMAGKDRFSDLKIETIPCAGSIKKEDVYHYLRNSADRLLILGCFEESCKHLSGDRKAYRIVNEVNERLKALNLGENRVIFKRLAPRMEEDLAGLLSRWKEGNCNL